MAAAGRRTRGLHARWFSRQQRLHLAALLIVFAALPLAAQSESDIEFDPSITQEQFAQFSRLVAQGIYATPVEPARARGIFGFDIGVAATAVPVDTNAVYWQRAVRDDFTVSDHVVAPRLVASKGFSFFTISAAYAKVPDTDVQMLGGSIDVPLMSGGLVRPTIALRGAYSQLQGVDTYDLKTYGAEIFISKGFGPITPYAALGQQRLDAEGRFNIPNTNTTTLSDNSSMTRYTVGVRLSLLLPKISVEATQAEERSYAAKISFGL